MQQYIVKEELSKYLNLSGEKFKYLVRVIRIKIGEEIILFNGQQKFIYIVDFIGKKEIKLIQKVNMPLNPSLMQIDLGFGTLKKDKNEWIIQKATELGVSNLYVLQLTNCISKLRNLDQKKKMRLEQIVESAVEQSKRDSIPTITTGVKINELELATYDYVFLAHEKYQEVKFGEYLTKIKDTFPNIDQIKILLLIGPEGGFTSDEIKLLEGHNNVQLISLGENILRAETAAIAALGAIKMMI